MPTHRLLTVVQVASFALRSFPAWMALLLSRGHIGDPLDDSRLNFVAFESGYTRHAAMEFVIVDTIVGFWVVLLWRRSWLRRRWRRQWLRFRNDCLFLLRFDLSKRRQSRFQKDIHPPLAKSLKSRIGQDVESCKPFFDLVGSGNPNGFTYRANADIHRLFCFIHKQVLVCCSVSTSAKFLGGPRAALPLSTCQPLPR